MYLFNVISGIMPSFNETKNVMNNIIESTRIDTNEEILIAGDGKRICKKYFVFLSKNSISNAVAFFYLKMVLLEIAYRSPILFLELATIDFIFTYYPKLYTPQTTYDAINFIASFILTKRDVFFCFSILVW